MMHVIDSVINHLDIAIKMIHQEYGTDDKVYSMYAESLNTEDPAELAELLRNMLTYIKGFKDYGKEFGNE